MKNEFEIDCEFCECNVKKCRWGKNGRRMKHIERKGLNERKKKRFAKWMKKPKDTAFLCPSTLHSIKLYQHLFLQILLNRTTAEYLDYGCSLLGFHLDSGLSECLFVLKGGLICFDRMSGEMASLAEMNPFEWSPIRAYRTRDEVHASSQPLRHAKSKARGLEIKESRWNRRATTLARSDSPCCSWISTSTWTSGTAVRTSARPTSPRSCSIRTGTGRCDMARA